MAAFDRDPRVVGTKVEGIPVYDVSQLGEIVPAAADPTGHDHRARHRRPSRRPISSWRPESSGIVNFAPVTLSLPEDVGLVGVDLTTELEQLAFSVANRTRSR